MTVRAEFFERDGAPCRIEVTGHAGYAPRGQDIVCSGISTVVTGAINALCMARENYNDSTYRAESGNMMFEYSGPTDQPTEIMFSMLLTQLETIAQTYPDHLKIYIDGVAYDTY